MTAELGTKYLGLHLRNPIVVSACPLTEELDVLRRIEEAGAGAAVLPSLFEEQLVSHREPDNPPLRHVETFTENLSGFGELNYYNKGPDVYLRHVEAAKRALSMPIIGSLNVTSPDGWQRFARLIAEAGADALELNIHLVPTDHDISSEQIEQRYVDLVSAVRCEIGIPLAVKVGPYFTAFAHVAQRFVRAGANGLVLFNRFLQPDIDLATMKVAPRLELSTPDESRLALRWIAIMYGRVDASLAATGGIHTGEDAVKLLLAGADVVEVASVLYQHGLGHLRTMIESVQRWLEGNDYASVEQIKGLLSYAHCPDPAAFERANYTKAISSFVDSVT